MPSIVQIFLASLWLVGAFAASSGVVWLMKRSKRLTSMTKSTADETVVRLMTQPIHVAFQAAGVLIALHELFPGLEVRGFGHGDLAFSVLFLWGSYTLSRVARGMLRWHEDEAHRSPDGTDQPGTFSFLRTIISLACWALGVMLVLNLAGVDISALLAGLGIAGLAVALALQETLAGVFSAIYLSIDKPIRQGDYVRLEDGTEGYVEDISMRSTRIRTVSDNLVIVPNTKLAKMAIKNYYLPAKEVGIVIPVQVACDEDLGEKEREILEAARRILSAHSPLEGVEPEIRYQAIGTTSVAAEVILRVRQYVDQHVVRHEFIKELSRNGICMVPEKG